MASKAKAAKNTLVQIGDGATSETFTTIGEVLSFSGPGEEAGEIDVTSQDSSAKEYISNGLADSPDMTIEVLFVGSNQPQQQLRVDLRAGTLRNFRYVLNDHPTNKTTATFAAIVKSFDGPSFSTGEPYKASISLKRSGETTWVYRPD